MSDAIRCRRRLAAGAALVVAIVAMAAGRGAAAADPNAVMFGIAGASATIADVGGIVGKAPALAEAYASFSSPDFDSPDAAAISAHGALPMLTWEPWQSGAPGVQQPRYALRKIASGAFDHYLKWWAAGARAYARPVLLRFAPEMNGNWNSWSAGVNGNTAADYVRAWRHVHAVFAAAGATNVQWIWSPNVAFPGSKPLRSLYPGDHFVDWIGLDGYNWGTTRASGWQTPAQIFSPTLAMLRRFTTKPILLTEVASAESGGDKAAWIEQFFEFLHRRPEILGFVWFDYDKEADWRLDSSDAARRAFTRGVSDVRVRGAVTQG